MPMPMPRHATARAARPVCLCLGFYWRRRRRRRQQRHQHQACARLGHEALVARVRTLEWRRRARRAPKGTKKEEARHVARERRRSRSRRGALESKREREGKRQRQRHAEAHEAELLAADSGDAGSRWQLAQLLGRQRAARAARLCAAHELRGEPVGAPVELQDERERRVGRLLDAGAAHSTHRDAYTVATHDERSRNARVINLRVLYINVRNAHAHTLPVMYQARICSRICHPPNASQ